MKLLGKWLFFEMGFGTGLNALLVWEEARKPQCPRTHYHTVELYPLRTAEADQLNYGTLLTDVAQPCTTRPASAARSPLERTM